MRGMSDVVSFCLRDSPPPLHNDLSCRKLPNLRKSTIYLNACNFKLHNLQNLSRIVHLSFVLRSRRCLTPCHGLSKTMQRRNSVQWTERNRVCDIVPVGYTSENGGSIVDDCIGRLLQPRTRSWPKQSPPSRSLSLVLCSVKVRFVVEQRDTGALRQRWEPRRPFDLDIRPEKSIQGPKHHDGDDTF